MWRGRRSTRKLKRGNRKLPFGLARRRGVKGVESRILFLCEKGNKRHPKDKGDVSSPNSLKKKNFVE